MSDNDLIRRGDAKGCMPIHWFHAPVYQNSAIAAIDAIPAAQVTVKPLEWFEVEKYRYGGKYTSEGYTIRYVEGFFILDFAGYGKAAWRFPTLEAAKAAAQADYAARIRSALTVTPAPDVGNVQALVKAVSAEIEARNLFLSTAPDRGGSHGPKGQRKMALENAQLATVFALAAFEREGK